MLRAQEFAALAGVTVRTLHHYDRLGLLKARRSATGYRLYSEHDLERLEQVVALKFLGVPLKQIKALLDGEPLELRRALSMQRRALEKRRQLLDHAIMAIWDAEEAIRSGTRPDAAIFKRIIEVIEMQNNADWAKGYYSDGARQKIEERQKLWSPELQARVSREWSELFRDVEAALDKDPASDEAQSLAQRWRTLVEEFTGGDAEVARGLSSMNQDRANWPAAMQEQARPYSDPKVWEFINRAFAAQKK